MAACKPVELCNHLMPSGKLCRGIALRNERYCRSHIRNHRLLDRDRAQNEALHRFAEKVRQMDLPDLLHTLHCRLENLNRAYSFARFHEISYLFARSLDILSEIKYRESIDDSQLRHNQLHAALPRLNSDQINDLLISCM